MHIYKEYFILQMIKYLRIIKMKKSYKLIFKTVKS